MVVDDEWKRLSHNAKEHAAGSSNARPSHASLLPRTAEASQPSALGSPAAHTSIESIGTL